MKPYRLVTRVRRDWKPVLRLTNETQAEALVKAQLVADKHGLDWTKIHQEATAKADFDEFVAVLMQYFNLE